MKRTRQINQRLLVIVAAATLALAAATHAAPEAPVGETILSASEPDYPPFCIVRSDGSVDGFSVELLRAALNATGRQVTFKTGVWTELKKDLAEGRIQALPLMGRTPEREAIYDFTFPYLTVHGTIVVRKNNRDIHGPADLKGKDVAVLAGDNAEEYLRRSKLGANVVPLASFETALKELSAGKHDAVVIQKLLAFQLMQNARIENLTTAGPPLGDFTQNFCFAVKKGDRELLATLNEGLAIVIADGTFRRLHTKWFSELSTLNRTRSRIVAGGDSDYPPYEFLDENGQPSGFNVDLTRALARKLGLQIEIRLASWGEIRKRLTGGEIDVVQGLFYSAERDAEFSFSPPYSVVEHVIVSRKGDPPFPDMKSLAGKKTLVMEGDLMEDLARKLGYEKQLLPVNSQEEALRRLVMGEGDAALVARVPASYWIEKHGWKNLSISATPVVSAEYCYGTPKGKEDLLSQLSEGLAAFKSTAEFREIQARWLSPYTSPPLSLRAVAKYVLSAAIPLLVLLVAAVVWSQTLKKQVHARTRELSEKSALLERQAGELFESREMLSSILDSIPQRVFWKDRNLAYLGCNKSFALDMGLGNPAEVAGRSDEDAPWKVHAHLYQADDRSVIETGIPKPDILEPHIAANGRRSILKTTKVPLHDKDGRIVGVLGTYEDVTGQREAEARIRHLNDVLISLRSVSQLLVRERNPQKLLQDACELLVKTRGYRMVWIGQATESSPRVVPVARAGEGLDYLDAVTITRDESPEGRGPTGVAWREGRPAVCANIDTDPDFAPWREKALEKGWGSSAAVPMMAGRTYGVLSVYADSPAAFDEEEVSLLLDLSGDLAHALRATEDEAQRKTAERALRESEQRFRLLTETIEDAFWIADREVQNTTYASASFERIWGRSRESLYNEPDLFFRTIHQDDLSVSDAIIQKARRSGQSFECEYRVVRPDGTVRWIRDRGFPVRDENGDVVSYAGVAQDITKQKQASEEIRLLAHALRSIGECVSITDIEDRILFVNEAFQETYGYREDELIGQPIEIVRTDKNRESATVEIRPATAKGGWQGELVNRRKDGTEFPIALSTSPVCDESGTPIALIGVARDITERKQAEDALRRSNEVLKQEIVQRQKAEEEVRRLNAELEDRIQSRTKQLEATNRELEGFSYSVSHDLRAPLRAIDGFSRLFLDDYSDKLDPEGIRRLEVVRTNAQRMGQLIDDILAFSRAGRHQIRGSRLNMENLVWTVWNELLQESPDPPAELRCQALPPASGDLTLIRQVLTNLLSNALKFSSRKERRIVEAGTQKTGAEVAYCIKDNGVGFDMKYAGKLFGVFQRLHGQTEFPGTGVGLSIVKRIIERHGGRVWAESQPGVGTAFFFTLPPSPSEPADS